jgi:hypothetical protein
MLVGAIMDNQVTRVGVSFVDLRQIFNQKVAECLSAPLIFRDEPNRLDLRNWICQSRMYLSVYLCVGNLDNY